MKVPESYAAVLAALPPALRPLVETIAPAVAALLRESQLDVDPIVDVCAVVPAPRRAVQRACREGKIAGAKKNGRAWLAKRSAIDAWLAEGGSRTSALATPANDEEDDELNALRSSLGLRLVGGTKSARGRR